MKLNTYTHDELCLIAKNDPKANRFAHQLAEQLGEFVTAAAFKAVSERRNTNDVLDAATQALTLDLLTNGLAAACKKAADTIQKD